jgi:hypothetical protein
MKRVASLLFLVFNISFFLTAQTPPPSQVSCNAKFQIRIDTIFSRIVRLVNISSIQNTDSISHIVKYDWDFGDLHKSFIPNPTHTYLHPDYYNICLTTRIVLRTDTNNVICESNYCKQTLIGNPKTYNIGGQIFGGNFPVRSGRADMFRIHPDNTINHIPSMMFDTLGYFYFFQIPEGNYILKVSVPDQGYFPTYFGNTVQWNKSKKVEVGKNLWSEDINLVPLKPTTGTGQIFGQLNIQNTNPGSIKNVEIILTDINSMPLIYTFTDRQGLFNFNGIAFGTYKLFADQVGWIHVDNTLTISETSPVATAQILLKWSPDGIESQFSILHSPFSINIFPVPSDNFIYIDITNQKAADWQFEIYTITGIKVNHSPFSILHSPFPIDISNLAKGIYLIKFTSKGNSIPIIKKFIKE